MGLLGHIAAGALQGAGQGITNNAIAKRQAALEAMRLKHQADAAQADRDYRSAEAATDRSFRSTEAREDRNWRSTEAEADDKRGFNNQAGLLAIGGRIQTDRDERQQTFEMKKIGAQHVNAKEMTRLESSLAQGRTAAEIKLRDSLESGEIKSVVKGKDGNYYGVTETGLVDTGVAAAAEAASDSGARLTDGEQEALYSDDMRAWREGGKKGEQPKRSDYIGRSRDAVAAPAAAPKSAPKAEKGEKPSPRAAALAQLGTIYANATPERYPGLFRNGKKISLQEAKGQIQQRYPE